MPCPMCHWSYQAKKLQLHATNVRLSMGTEMQHDGITQSAIQRRNVEDMGNIKSEHEVNVVDIL